MKSLTASSEEDGTGVELARAAAERIEEEARRHRALMELAQIAGKRR